MLLHASLAGEAGGDTGWLQHTHTRQQGACLPLPAGCPPAAPQRARTHLPARRRGRRRARRIGSCRRGGHPTVQPRGSPLGCQPEVLRAQLGALGRVARARGARGGQHPPVGRTPSGGSLGLLNQHPERT